MTSNFGRREAPEPGASRNHNGTDFRAREGATVQSTQNGVVSSVGERARGGNTIIVENDDGSRSGYAHTSALPGIEPGAVVSAESPIGTSDGSGTATPHLHYTYTPPGATAPVDPLTTQLQNVPDICEKGSEGCTP